MISKYVIPVVCPMLYLTHETLGQLSQAMSTLRTLLSGQGVIDYRSSPIIINQPSGHYFIAMQPIVTETITYCLILNHL